MFSSSSLKSSFLIISAFVAGSLISIATTVALAHGGDATKVHGCVMNTLLTVRIVAAGTNCLGTETAVDWDQNSNYGLPYNCHECSLAGFDDKFAGKDFSYSTIRRSNFINADLTGANFSNSDLFRTQFSESDLTNVNFSNISFTQSGFNLANLTNTDFSNSSMLSTNLSESNMSNTNFTNVPFTNSDLTGATNATTATFTGATWDNVTCPDGTNSNDNSNTCIGHLTP